MSEKTDRRTYLKVVGGTVGGLVVGGAIGYLAKPSEVVEKTITQTQAATKTLTATGPTITATKRILRVINWGARPAFDKLWMTFEQKRPDVELVIDDNPLQGHDYYTYYEQKLATEQPLDIFPTSAGMYVMKLVGLDLLLDLTAALKARTDFVVNPSVMENQLGPPGKVYAYPWSILPFPLVYNKKIFDEYGLKPPKSWDEFHTIIETLYKPDQDLYPFAFPGGFTWYGPAWIITNPVLQTVGYNAFIKAWEHPDQLKFDDPLFAEGIKEAKYLFDRSAPGTWTRTWDEEIAMVAAGKAAISMGHPDHYVKILKASPPGMGPEDYGVFPYPPRKAGGKPTVHVALIAMMINKKTADPDLAIEFLNYIMSPELSKEYARKFDETGYAFSPIPEANLEYTDPVMVDYGKAMSESDLVLCDDTQITTAPEFIDYFRTQVDKALAGETTAEQAVALIEKRAVELRA